MSGTRSAFPKAPATSPREAVLIAFGSPSDPLPPQAATERLAQSVAAQLDGWQLRGATIAQEGAIARAFDGLSERAIVFPLLMADGWILRRLLADALRQAGRGGAQVLAPLGLLPEFAGFCAEVLDQALNARALSRRETAVVLAAHGSARGPRPAACAHQLCEALERRLGLRAVLPGFLEEPPYLADALADAAQPALCLPCFVVEAYHAGHDVPEAARKAGFAGDILPPIGTLPGLHRVIAGTLRQAEGTRAVA